jgi:uncharacterized DUF497 family protein
MPRSGNSLRRGEHLALKEPAKRRPGEQHHAGGRFAILFVGIIYSAVITYRGENTRIISARRSRDEEIELYENESLQFR